ncbi:metallophosphoesterase [Pseudodesulfovibrio sp.]|uniref:metallophosphoesterase n=1 Tax=unclassified Pseudodesulfovibrio TaxID=2661612 RepID=UPI003AFFEABB
MYWIAFGDIHEATGAVASIPGLAEAEGVIITGDLTNRGGRPEGERVLDAVAAVNPRILALPGNMDTEAVQAVMRDRGVDLHLKASELAPGLGCIGIGLSTPTPFGTPGEVPEETLAGWLDDMAAKVPEFEHVILAIHQPPLDSSLDRVSNGMHVGSPAVRRFIEQVGPDVVVTGHIHESRAVETIGQSLVVNPGALADGGYVRIEFEGGALSAKLLGV